MKDSKKKKDWNERTITTLTEWSDISYNWRSPAPLPKKAEETKKIWEIMNKFFESQWKL